MREAARQLRVPLLAWRLAVSAGERAVAAAGGAGRWLLVTLLALFWSASAAAVEVPPLQGRVNDTAGILSGAQAQALEQKLAAYEQQSGRQFVLLTLPSLEGEPIETYALRVVEQWQLGRKQEDDGLLMVVSVADRRMRIEVGYGLEGDIPDALAGRIIRNVMAPQFRENDYAGGINAAFDTLMRAAGGEQVQLPQTKKKEANWISLVGPLFWLGLFMFFGLSGRRRGFMFLPLGMGGGHRGGFGGGGFGGGGFSGGGGSFGGGGASGGW